MPKWRSTDGHIVALRADVIGDVGAYSIYPWTAALEPVQVVSFLAGPYRVPLPRPRAACHLEGADRPVSRRRPADLDFVMERLMDMAAASSVSIQECGGAISSRDDELPDKAASGIVWDDPLQEYLELPARPSATTHCARIKTARAAGR